MSEIPIGKKCMVVGCNSMVKAKDLCAMHYQRSLRHDGFTGDTRSNPSTCSVADCERQTVAKGLCQMHYYRLQRTGTTDPSVKVEKVCEVEGCDGVHVANGLCAKHYKRMKRHGDVIQTRSSDWGARERHPLYKTWNALLKYHGSEVCDRWRDLWSFVEDMNGTRPSPKHRLRRLNESSKFGPGNVYWGEPRVRNTDPDALSTRAAYMREWYANNRETVVNADLRKRYGITLADYGRMFEDQDGTCAICRREETRVDHRTKKVSRLAVDHDHKTGDVRGLLCHHCNNALGAFDDDLGSIMAATIYLAKHSTDGESVLRNAIIHLQAALPPAGTA